MAGMALVQSRLFLERWGDPVTRRERDDLVQETAWATFCQATNVRDQSCIPAMVRTISRRLRHRALSRAARRAVVFGGNFRPVDRLRVCESTGPCLLVAGRPVPVARLLNMLEAVMWCLPPLNRRLLRAFYEGFSCLELADRFELTEEGVKMRLHRSRRRLRKAFEVTIRVADGLVD
jgi:DNA-directed RNA polymerase specialized sigma24 family protein